MKLSITHEELIVHDDQWLTGQAVEATATIRATDEDGRRWEVKRVLRMRLKLDKEPHP